MQAKKRFGQNFLIDNNIIEKIVQSFSAAENDLIIEIGPGRGALTKKLIKKGAALLAYEIDTDMKEHLDPIESDLVRIKYQDILSADLSSDIKADNYKNIFIVGNLPYYITTPIIEHITNQDISFSSFTMMVQKEVADRFMAEPKTKDYGYFTLYLKHYYQIKKICDVPRRCFNPAPNVDSAVIQLIPIKHKDPGDAEYFAFLKKCFSQKRKTLKNNLGQTDYNKIESLLCNNGFDEKTRAEAIPENLFYELYNTIKD